MSKKQQVNFRIDTDLLEALKQQAKVEGVSYTDLIQRFCRLQLADITMQSIDSTIDSAIRSEPVKSNIQTAGITIHNTIQPDIIKEQLREELREELAGSINELVKVNLEGIRSELLGE